MQMFKIRPVTSPLRFVLAGQNRIPALLANSKESGSITNETAGVNYQQVRNYDRERRYDYTDRRYEKDFDLRYDKPSSWTLHPNYKLKMHFEEHASQRGKSMFIFYSAVFGWLFFTIFAMTYFLPYPERWGQPGTGNQGYLKWFGGGGGEKKTSKRSVDDNEKSGEKSKRSNEDEAKETLKNAS